jgi:dihydroorotase
MDYKRSLESQKWRVEYASSRFRDVMATIKGYHVFLTVRKMVQGSTPVCFYVLKVFLIKFKKNLFFY